MIYNKWATPKKTYSGRKSKVPIVHLKEGENPWITYMKRRVFKENSCVNGMIIGDPGMGKSWSMLSIACALDPDFELEGNLFFKGGKMMRAIKEYYTGANSKPKKGKDWYLDEAGIDANALNYHDAINKGLNAFFQTARHRNYIFFMTVPQTNFVSKGVRTLMTTFGKANGWDKNTGMTKISMRVMEYNGDIDKYYRKRLFVYADGRMMPCNESRLPAPPNHIIKEYESLKKEFTGDLFESIADEIENFEDRKSEKYNKKAPTKRQLEILELIKSGRSVDDIATLFGSTKGLVTNRMTGLQKKGYRFDPVRDEKTNRVMYYKVKEPIET